jgi:hypothetical protein
MEKDILKLVEKIVALEIENKKLTGLINKKENKAISHLRLSKRVRFLEYELEDAKANSVISAHSSVLEKELVSRGWTLKDSKGKIIR